MVQMLRDWVCDQCDLERKRAQRLPTGPYVDPDYETISAKVETGDHNWANLQLQNGRAIEFVTCSHDDKRCDGWQYRYYRGFVEQRHAARSPMWRSVVPLNPGKHVAFKTERTWVGHTFRLISR